MNEGKRLDCFSSVDISFLVCINFAIIQIQETVQERKYRQMSLKKIK